MPSYDGLTFRSPATAHVHPPTRRPDGSWRKPVKIKKGWTGDLDGISDDEDGEFMRGNRRNKRIKNNDEMMDDIKTLVERWSIEEQVIPVRHNRGLSQVQEQAQTTTPRDVLINEMIELGFSNILNYLKILLIIVIVHCALVVVYIKYLHNASVYGYLTIFLLLACYFMVVSWIGIGLVASHYFSRTNSLNR